MSKQKQKNNFCTQHVVNLYFSGNSMNNLLSYCGLTDARMRASEKDLPVPHELDKNRLPGIHTCDKPTVNKQGWGSVRLLLYSARNHTERKQAQAQKKY